MSYTEDRDGYAIETTWCDGTTIDAAGDTTYLMGALASRNEWPSPTYSAVYSAPGVNAKEVGASKVFKSKAEYRGMITLMLQNGIPIMLAMGKSTTPAPAGAIYTHTITPYTDGTQLPSVVWQHEEKGTGTNEEYQFQGCKVDSLVLSHDFSGPDMLMGKMEIMGGASIDPGFASTNDPALPATANADPFINLTRTWDYLGTDTDLTGLVKVEISIINALTPKYSPSWDTVYTGRDPYMLKEANRKQYMVHLTIHPDTVEREIWDELITASNLKELYFKWQRSATDYIAVTCTDCEVLRHDIVTDVDAPLKLVVIEMEPRALSFTVVDSIEETAYNE